MYIERQNGRRKWRVCKTFFFFFPSFFSWFRSSLTYFLSLRLYPPQYFFYYILSTIIKILILARDMKWREERKSFHGWHTKEGSGWRINFLLLCRCRERLLNLTVLLFRHVIRATFQCVREKIFHRVSFSMKIQERFSFVTSPVHIFSARARHN